MKTGVSQVFGWLACAGLLLGSVVSASAQPAASVWPLFHGDAQRTGRTTVAGPTNANNVRIAYQGYSAFRTSPVIGPDGTVYFANGRNLCALDPSNDTIKPGWCNDLNSNAHLASPAVGIDPFDPMKVVIYQGGRDNRMHAVDQNGVTRWTFLVGLDGDVATSAVMTASAVYFGGSTRLHAMPPNSMQPASGNPPPIWVRGLDSPVFMANPMLSNSGNVVYVGTSRGSLYSFTADASGTMNWVVNVGRNIRFGAAAVAPNGTIYVGTRDGLVKVTDNGMSATVNWTFPMGGRGCVSTPAIGSDGTIYVGGQGDVVGAGATFFAIPATWQPGQNPLWVYQTDKFFRGSPVLDGAGRIYTTTGHSVVALNANGNNNPVWTFTTSRNIFSSPALDADGTLWVTGADRNLYAISN
jgi:outer membrane protein assembly factor BamB